MGPPGLSDSEVHELSYAGDKVLMAGEKAAEVMVPDSITLLLLSSLHVGAAAQQETGAGSGGSTLHHHQAVVGRGTGCWCSQDQEERLPQFRKETHSGGPSFWISHLSVSR